MNITKSQLEQIIQEEVANVLAEKKIIIEDLTTSLGSVVKALHSAKPPRPQDQAAAYEHLVNIVKNNPEKVKEHGSPEYYANQLALELKPGNSPNEAFVPQLAAHLKNALQGK